MNEFTKKEDEKMTIPAETFLERKEQDALKIASRREHKKSFAADRLQMWLNDSTGIVKTNSFQEFSKEYEFPSLIEKISQNQNLSVTVLDDNIIDSVCYEELATWCSIQFFEFGSKRGEIFQGQNETLKIGACEQEDVSK